MRPGLILLGLLISCASAFAELAAPNGFGVAMGHLHYYVEDLAANERFWLTLGGTSVTIGGERAVRFPDVIVILSQGDYTGLSKGSVLNHIAFRVPSLETIEARGLKLERPEGYPGVASTFTPEGEMVELFDNAATNLTFTPDEPTQDSTYQRHNRPQEAAINFHHVHLYLPEGAEARRRTGTARVFGGTRGKRADYTAVDLPGINLNFSDRADITAPTRGRMLDHLGLEVADLEAFCKRVATLDVKFDTPYVVDQRGIGRAMLTDPWGTTIELTEGLRRY